MLVTISRKWRGVDWLVVVMTIAVVALLVNLSALLLQKSDMPVPQPVMESFDGLGGTIDLRYGSLGGLQYQQRRRLDKSRHVQSDFGQSRDRRHSRSLRFQPADICGQAFQLRFISKYGCRHAIQQIGQWLCVIYHHGGVPVVVFGPPIHF